MLYIFAVQVSLSPLEMVKIRRRSCPAFNVPCQLPERSCASAPVPNIATSTTAHSSGLFMECPPINAVLGDGGTAYLSQQFWVICIVFLYLTKFQVLPLAKQQRRELHQVIPPHVEMVCARRLHRGDGKPLVLQ